MRTIGAAIVLASALAMTAIVYPANAAQSACVSDRDTTASCRVQDMQTQVVFPAHKSAVIKVPGSKAYSHGLIVIIPQPVKGHSSIQKSDKIDLKVDASGRIALMITTSSGQVRSHFTAVTMVRPPHFEHLYMLTSHGYMLVKDNKVTQPGLYRWVW